MGALRARVSPPPIVAGRASSAGLAAVEVVSPRARRLPVGVSCLCPRHDYHADAGEQDG